jgi:hypothetical protein
MVKKVSFSMSGMCPGQKVNFSMAGMCHGQKVSFSMSGMGRGENTCSSMAEMCHGQYLQFQHSWTVPMSKSFSIPSHSSQTNIVNKPSLISLPRRSWLPNYSVLVSSFSSFSSCSSVVTFSKTYVAQMSPAGSRGDKIGIMIHHFDQNVTSWCEGGHSWYHN